ncbi:Orn/Lys/Arg decarboxylase, C-terminal [Artemisia annua]|uniref:Orn/Lys/Arg decarboxylase, C-terminal n=1 Tax=Artemisia annua TaxID=35608 RepID=A0A2U1NC88_ARTAN|nr:Orn/Lys/Arg decarboxylase, C-terminal [Artemisia annua]
MKGNKLKLAIQTINSSENSYLNLRCKGTLRACNSKERNHGRKQNDKIGNLKENRIVMNNMIIFDSQDSGHYKHDPPLVKTLKTLAEQNVANFQFPGHNRGRAAPSSLSEVIGIQPFLHDMHALPELGNLFSREGAIWDAQKQAAELFGASETWFLVGGTTCGIQASIMATCSPGDTLILPRNAHKSTFSSMVLCGAIPKYLFPEYDYEWDIAGGITPSQASGILFKKKTLIEIYISSRKYSLLLPSPALGVEKAIKELDTEGRKASAVLITSPTYHGICSNLEKISFLCHSYNIPLIVDEAHGAHLGFHENLPRSALSQGVDLSIQSTHKVLCSFTQSSMLHMSGNIVDRERISQCLQSLQTTSPNHMLLASLDAARAQISKHPKTIFNKPFELAMDAKALIEKIPGITVLNSCTFSDVVGIDSLRITVGVWKLGISGFEADCILYKNGVISELQGARSLMFAINLGTTRDDVVKLVEGLKNLSQRHASIRVNVVQPFIGTISNMILSPREAFFTSKMKVSLKGSIGKVCGELVCPFPPGIPLLVPGEVITAEALNYIVEVKNNGGFISGVADSTLSSIVVCIQ